LIGGALTWNRSLSDTEKFAREHAEWGYNVRLIERRDIVAMEPNLIDPPELAAFAADEGAINPIATTIALVDAAKRAAAGIVLDAGQVSLRPEDGRVIGVKIGRQSINADVVVVSAGIRSRALCEPLPCLSTRRLQSYCPSLLRRSL